MSRTASELPKRASPSTANVLDAREKLRMLSELPRETTSSTERENNEPNRARPTADRDEPHRANWRRLKELPMWAMFRTLSDEPKRARPRTVIVLEIRAKFRKLNELPRWRKSSTDTPLPKRAIPIILAALDIRAKHRRLRELPRWRKSRTESA
jgi:hypothetical protein